MDLSSPSWMEQGAFHLNLDGFHSRGDGWGNSDESVGHLSYRNDGFMESAPSARRGGALTGRSVTERGNLKLPTTEHRIWNVPQPQSDKESSRSTENSDGRPLVGRDCRPRVGQRVVGAHNTPFERLGIGTVCEVGEDSLVCFVRWDAERESARRPIEYCTGLRGVCHLEIASPEDEQANAKIQVQFHVGPDGKRVLLPPSLRRHIRTEQSEESPRRVSVTDDLSPRKRREALGTRLPQPSDGFYLEDVHGKILWELFIRFALGYKRKRYHSYDLRALKKQEIESMDLRELKMVMELFSDAMEWPFLPDILSYEDIEAQYKQYASRSDPRGFGELDFERFIECLESMCLQMGISFGKMVHIAIMYIEGKSPSIPKIKRTQRYSTFITQKFDPNRNDTGPKSTLWDRSRDPPPKYRKLGNRLNMGDGTRYVAKGVLGQKMGSAGGDILRCLPSSGSVVASNMFQSSFGAGFTRSTSSSNVTPPPGFGMSFTGRTGGLVEGGEREFRGVNVQDLVKKQTVQTPKLYKPVVSYVYTSLRNPFSDKSTAKSPGEVATSKDTKIPPPKEAPPSPMTASSPLRHRSAAPSLRATVFTSPPPRSGTAPTQDMAALTIENSAAPKTPTTSRSPSKPSSSPAKPSLPPTRKSRLGARPRAGRYVSVAAMDAPQTAPPFVPSSSAVTAGQVTARNAYLNNDMGAVETWEKDVERRLATAEERKDVFLKRIMRVQQRERKLLRALKMWSRWFILNKETTPWYTGEQNKFWAVASSEYEVITSVTRHVKTIMNLPDSQQILIKFNVVPRSELIAGKAPKWIVLEPEILRKGILPDPTDLTKPPDPGTYIKILRAEDVEDAKDKGHNVWSRMRRVYKESVLMSRAEKLTGLSAATNWSMIKTLQVGNKHWIDGVTQRAKLKSTLVEFSREMEKARGQSPVERRRSGSPQKSRPSSVSPQKSKPMSSYITPEGSRPASSDRGHKQVHAHKTPDPTPAEQHDDHPEAKMASLMEQDFREDEDVPGPLHRLLWKARMLTIQKSHISYPGLYGKEYFAVEFCVSKVLGKYDQDVRAPLCLAEPVPAATKLWLFCPGAMEDKSMAGDASVVERDIDSRLENVAESAALVSVANYFFERVDAGRRVSHTFLQTPEGAELGVKLMRRGSLPQALIQSLPKNALASTAEHHHGARHKHRRSSMDDFSRLKSEHGGLPKSAGTFERPRSLSAEFADEISVQRAEWMDSQLSKIRRDVNVVEAFETVTSQGMVSHVTKIMLKDGDTVRADPVQVERVLPADGTASFDYDTHEWKGGAGSGVHETTEGVGEDDKAWQVLRIDDHDDSAGADQSGWSGPERSAHEHEQQRHDLDSHRHVAFGENATDAEHHIQKWDHIDQFKDRAEDREHEHFYDKDATKSLVLDAEDWLDWNVDPCAMDFLDKEWWSTMDVKGKAVVARFSWTEAGGPDNNADVEPWIYMAGLVQEAGGAALIFVLPDSRAFVPDMVMATTYNGRHINIPVIFVPCNGGRQLAIRCDSKHQITIDNVHLRDLEYEDAEIHPQPE